MDQGSSIVPLSNPTGQPAFEQSLQDNFTSPTEFDTGKQIITQPNEISLASLTESDIGKTIYARVYRKWTPTNKQGKPVVFCCMLIDKQGGAIQANVNLREKNKFDALLQLTKTYKITGYGFQPAKKWMQVVPHSLSLAFGTYTDIKSIPDTGFPEHYFNFRSYRDLYTYVDVKEGLLTDYIGCVQYVTEIQKSVKTTPSASVWRDIGIQNLDGRTVRFTLWNQDAETFRQTEYEKSEKPVIIAVSSCMVKNYGGLQLSSTAATCYYFNPKIPECQDIRNVYEEFMEPPTILNIRHQRCADPEQEKWRNRVTLAELAAENPQNHQNVRFTIVATITGIDTKRTWFYKKCFDCKSKISERYPHSHCKQPTSEADLLYSYCFRVWLFDETAYGTMTCFSNEANVLIKDCKELLKTIPMPDPYDYPPELLSLEGKRKIFQLRFDPECTKEKQVFILDNCWDDTPMLTSNVATAPESDISSSAENLVPKKNVQPNTEICATPLPETAVEDTATPESQITALAQLQEIPEPQGPIPATEKLETKEGHGTPATQQTPLAESSNPKNERPKRSARKILFADDKDEPASMVAKKPKKGE